MDFNALDAEDYALGQAMVAMPATFGVSAGSVSSYPDSIPAATAPTYSNGWSMKDFTSGLKSVANSVSDVAKTVYGLEHSANQLSLQRLQTASAIDVTKAQTAAARDVALAESMTASARAQTTLNAAKQSAQLNAQLGGSDLLVLAMLAGAAYLIAKAAA